ncbi:MAG: trigger factor [Pseudomonadota bacterium]
MQLTEVVNEGLKREFKVVVSSQELSSKLDEKLDDLKGKVRINGFRPGKVPVAHLKKLYGKSAMAEIVQETVDENAKAILTERDEKSAQQPEVNMTEDEAEAEKVLAGEADFEFSLSYEVLPDFEPTDASTIKIERPIVEVDESEVDEQVQRVAESTRSYEAKEGKAENGDRVSFSYLGKIDGEPFEGGADEDAKLVLGSNSFIPGFEDQLVGMQANDEGTIKVTFPEDYGAAELAGKEAEFDVSIAAVESAGDLEIDDETAKQLGLESLEKLKEIVRGQIESQYGSHTRQKVKRQLLDALDEKHDFELPEKLVAQEFDNIWNQITNDLEEAGKSFEDEETTEEESRAEYQKLATRRVRLGLVLSKIGEDAKVEVTEEELQRGLYERIRQFPGQEQEAFEFYKNNPDALASIRAPLFEDKVVDHLLAQADVTDKVVSKEELLADDEAEEDA